MLTSAISAVGLFLLAASGLSKLADWTQTSGSLESARLPSGRAVVSLLGIVEVVAALVGLAIGGRWLIPATLLYLGFAAFTAWALRLEVPLQSCGCFGRGDTPPTTIHLAYNLVVAAALALASLGSFALVDLDRPIIEVFSSLAFSGIGAYLSYLLLAVLPTTFIESRT